MSGRPRMVIYKLFYGFLSFYSFVISGTSCKHLTVADTVQSNSISNPFGVRWHILGDSVVMSWRYSQKAMPPDGFYIKLQEYGSNGMINTPDFIPVQPDPRALSIDIQGLKPKSSYLAKVIAFAKGHTKSSRVVRISTHNLEFLKIHEFEATSITDSKAVFVWKHDVANLVSELKFKISCSGESKYYEDGKEKIDQLNLEYVTQEAALEMEKYTVTDLVPSSVYTCSIVTLTDTFQSEPYSEIEFKTLAGRPVPPPPPRIIVSSPDKKIPHFSFEVDLFETIERNGPISHYKVFAVPVTRGRHTPKTMPFTPIIPLDKLLSKAVSAHLAASVSDKLPFLVGIYQAHKLPRKLIFNGKVDFLDFKPDTYYAFVTAAFTDTKDSTDLKYTLSSPSSPPVYIGPDTTEEWVKERKPAAQRFASIVIMTLISTIFTLSLIVFIIVGLAYMKQKQYGSLSFNDDSDNEMFLNSPKKGKKRLIQSPRIRQTHNKTPYYMLNTDESGRFQMKSPVEKIKSSKFDELEPMPELYAVTPPNSPHPSNHPTSPLIRSRREEIHLVVNPHPQRTSPKQSPRQHSPSSITSSQPPPTFLQRYNDYLDSSVATSVNMDDDRLAYRHPLPSRRPYTSPTQTQIGHAYYSSAHPPSPRHPPINPPETPPSSNAVRIGTREGYTPSGATGGYIVPNLNLPRRSMVKELEKHDTFLVKKALHSPGHQHHDSYQHQDTKRNSIHRYCSVPTEEMAHLDESVLLTSNSALLISDILSDDGQTYVDASELTYEDILID